MISQRISRFTHFVHRTASDTLSTTRHTHWLNSEENRTLDQLVQCLTPFQESIAIRSLGTKPEKGPPPQGIAIEQRLRQRPSVQYKSDSPETIAEPYPGRRRWITPLDLFHPKGWKEIRTRVTDIVKDIYHYRTCKKHMDDFTLRKLREDALKLYKDVCNAAVVNDKVKLRKCTTIPAMMQMQREITARKTAGGRRIVWSLEESHSRVRLVRVRILGIPDNRFVPSFAQCTFRFKNRQRFALYNGKDEIIAGSEKDVYDVEDYWILERVLKKGDPSSKWRVAARLALPSSQ